MDFKKIYKRGLVVSILLLFFIIGVFFIPNASRKQLLDENPPSLSASEDGYEENDDYLSAYDLSAYEDTWLNTINGTGAQWDDDWYEIYINPGYEHLEVNLIFSHGGGDIDIELYDSSGIVSLTGSYGVVDNEYINFIVPSPGVHYLRIYLANNGNAYDLWWNTNMPTDDAYEENDFDWEAFDLSPWPASWLPFGLGVQSDDDWYTVYCGPGREHIYAQLSFSHAAGNIDMEIWYWDGVFTYLTGSYSFDDYEYIDTYVPWSGTYFIKVFGNNAGNQYDLWWEDLMVTGGDDYMEENDDYGSAQWVNPSSYPSLKLVYGDEDWFRTFLNTGDTIDISIYFDHFAGDLQLELYDPVDSINPRDGSYSPDNNEFISFTANVQGDWRFRVFHQHGDSEVWYDLDIKINAGGSGNEDMYEPNDYIYDAYDLTSDEGRWLSGINGLGTQFNEDWYKIYVEPNFEHLFVGFHQWGDDIQLEVYDENLNVLGGSHYDNHGGPIRVNLPSSGNYYLKVSGDDIGTNYDLHYIGFCLLEEQTMLSDVYGMGVQNDVDFYLIDVSFGFLQLQINLTFTHILGNIDMTLYNEWGSDIIKGDSPDDNEFIDVILDYPGMYFLVIYGYNMGNEYDLRWDDIKTDPRSDDDYEENDDWSSAFDITLYEDLWLMPKFRPEIQTYEQWYKTYANRTGIQADEDWYKIYIDQTNVQLIVDLRYDSAEGLMGFDIFDADINKITGNFTLTDNDYIIYEISSNGTYYIKVFGDNSGNIYNLMWRTQEPEEIGEIPGYDLLILIGSFIGISTVGIKIKRSKLKHK